jgi:hypothetical protein
MFESFVILFHGEFGNTTSFAHSGYSSRAILSGLLLVESSLGLVLVFHIDPGAHHEKIVSTNSSKTPRAQRRSDRNEVLHEKVPDVLLQYCACFKFFLCIPVN